MSISEQVKELRELSDSVDYKMYRWNDYMRVLNEAADTIESLSAKLQAANKEIDALNAIREVSDEVTENLKWIPCSERMPEENEEVICCFKSGVVKALVLFNCKFHGKVYAYEKADISAWKPLPEPYKGNT